MLCATTIAYRAKECRSIDKVGPIYYHVTNFSTSFMLDEKFANFYELCNSSEQRNKSTEYY